jgi:hypothetical protein
LRTTALDIECVIKQTAKKKMRWCVQIKRIQINKALKFPDEEEGRGGNGIGVISVPSSEVDI